MQAGRPPVHAACGGFERVPGEASTPHWTKAPGRLGYARAPKLPEKSRTAHGGPDGGVDTGTYRRRPASARHRVDRSTARRSEGGDEVRELGGVAALDHVDHLAVPVGRRVAAPPQPSRF